MNAEQGLLKDICANPEDIITRLIYADWLEEHGQTCPLCGGTGRVKAYAGAGRDGARCKRCHGTGSVPAGSRAEFIRVQIELAEEDHPVDCDECLCWCRDPRFREQELLGAHALEWSDPIMETGLAPAVIHFGNGEYGYGDCRWRFRRGFVEAVSLPCADWCGGACVRCEGRGSWEIDAALTLPATANRLYCPDCNKTGRRHGHGPALVRATPLREVRLSDKVPWRHDGTGEFWWGEERTHRHPAVGSESLLPHNLYSRLPRPVFDSTEEASTGLSQACIQYAWDDPQGLTQSPQANALPGATALQSASRSVV